MNFSCKNVSKSWKLLYVLKTEHIFTTRTQKSDWKIISKHSVAKLCVVYGKFSHFLSYVGEFFHKYMYHGSCWKSDSFDYNLLAGVTTTTTTITSKSFKALQIVSLTSFNIFYSQIHVVLWEEYLQHYFK